MPCCAHITKPIVFSVVVTLALLMLACARAQQNPAAQAQPAAPDAIAEAQTPRQAPAARVEQQKNEHDQSDAFKPDHAPHSAAALKDQPDQGKVTGFDFSRDPLNAKKPMQTFEESMQQDVADKPNVMAAHRKFLETRYNLEPKLDPEARMSRGKPIPVGPTARLREGMSWEALGNMAADEIKKNNGFPYPPLPHPKHVAGGQVFPQAQTAMFPRLERFDVEFDLPEAFIPEFPPAIFLQNRPELGDVSRGEVVSINNFHRLFKDLLAPVQLDGLRMLVTPLPQEEFNATDDARSHSRRSASPAWIVTSTAIQTARPIWSATYAPRRIGAGLKPRACAA